MKRGVKWLEHEDPELGTVRLCRGCGEDFQQRIRRTPTCWLWTGSVRNAQGYGQFKHHNERLTAHRAAWELAVGPIPDGLFVLHRCDNPPCVRPSHLFLGTLTDNNRDRAAKGRSALGERSGTHRLTDATVREMRVMSASGVPTKEIARRVGIDSGNASRIVRGLAWGHVR